MTYPKRELQDFVQFPIVMPKIEWFKLLWDDQNMKMKSKRNKGKGPVLRQTLYIVKSVKSEAVKY